MCRSSVQAHLPLLPPSLWYCHKSPSTIFYMSEWVLSSTVVLSGNVGSCKINIWIWPIYRLWGHIRFTFPNTTLLHRNWYANEYKWWVFSIKILFQFTHSAFLSVKDTVKDKHGKSPSGSDGGAIAGGLIGSLIFIMAAAIAVVVLVIVTRKLYKKQQLKKMQMDIFAVWES